MPGRPKPFPSLDSSELGQLMPMFLWLDRQGRVMEVGPTLARVLGRDAAGTRFEDHFVLRRLRLREPEVPVLPPPDGTAVSPKMSFDRGALRLHLDLLGHPGVGLRGASVALGSGGAEGVLLNLTFGIHMSEAVREFGLTEADFAASDLAIELLYLGEANAAVLGELGEMTARLELARRSAVVQSLTDPLTGLANRRAFDAALAEEIDAQAHGGAAFTVAHVDLDYFKEVNDTLGHPAGDHVLKVIARRLVHALRKGDLVARTGGDEFLLLLRGLSDRERLLRLGERLIADVEAPCEFRGTPCRVSASIGLETSVGYDPMTTDALLAAADRALYAAKRSGRGRAVPVPERAIGTGWNEEG